MPASPVDDTRPTISDLTQSAPVLPDSTGHDKESPTDQETTSLTRSTSRVRRISAVVEKTVDKLGRSLTGKSPPTSPSGHRRLFSINRKVKEKENSLDSLNDNMAQSSTGTLQAQVPTSPPREPPASSNPTPGDDSPFITPPSPTLNATRPSLMAFRGDGSIRAGTQTLIQALHALPWSDEGADDDVIYNQHLESIESDSDEENDKPSQLASSIHTIYRPLARSRKQSVGPPVPRRMSTLLSDTEQSSEEPSPSEDEDADEIEDFERTPTIPHANKPVSFADSPPSSPAGFFSRTASAVPARMVLSRSRAGSMATVKLHRRTQLAEKLKEVFELPAIETVKAEMPCWLLRSVLLQGYMYLTNSHLCFFAHMPSREDQILKSGSLNKKAQRTKRWIKHWFVLKNDALSWYQSSSDPYFPHGIVDLRYAISCDAVGEKDFRLRTNQKTVVLSGDSVPSRDEWVKAIKKVIFKAQNMGDSVKIAIPYSAVLDVDKSTAIDFSETIEVKVLENEPHFSIDSFFFAYFHDLPGALDQIRDAIRLHRTSTEDHEKVAEVVLDTTTTRTNNLITGHHVERTVSMPNPEVTGSRPLSMASGFKLSSILKPFSSSPQAEASNEVTPEEFTHIDKRANSTSFVPVTTSGAAHPDLPHSISDTQAIQHLDHTYPPSTSLGSVLSSTWSVPNWLKGTKSSRIFGINSSEPASTSTLNQGGVKEMYSSASGTSSKWSGGDMAFSVLETPEGVLDTEVIDRFRSTFAYDEKETLLGYFTGYIFRLLPIFGKLYVSTNYFCFKSSGALAARTRMALPIQDIISTEKSKGTRFGHHGLIIIIRGHEELFFEFGAESKRDAFAFLLERQKEDVTRRLAQGDHTVPTRGTREALILEEFDQAAANQDDQPGPVVESMSDSLPAVMFTSASSTFLTFKPSKSLHFTCLTIGSRGDVQPYIALAKGLMADGHRVKIATHGEFQEWIESHGIEFGNVGGDPAELMRICVENGMFTVSFLKEGLQKFRGWLDDLLQKSWDVSQGTDVLIESPSAMGGYHIAEALGIPYFRAFTMTWTRTRAYPHAFAVPERKMGGSYNYMSYVMFDQVFWRAISGQINRWRRNVLHIGGTSLDRMEPHKIPFLYNFSPSVVPPPLDWPEWIRVTGYWFLDEADVSGKKWNPPSDLVTFIDTAHANNKKVVYIGFGSIVVSDPAAMTKTVIEAIVKSGVYAILSKGWSDRLHVKTSEATEPEEPLPPQIYSISSIPHDWLFPRIDAACHHGGAGTTGASLRAGIPTIIRPFFGDQFFWGDRVEALGIGSAVRKLTVESLTEALLLATTDIKQIDRAKLIGEQIRKESGVATAVESIYRDLEYARSLIKGRSASDSDSGNSEDDEEDTEHGTIRTKRPPRGSVQSEYSSNESGKGAPSEDWSVISEQDERRNSVSSSAGHNRRSSLAAAVLSVLPDSFSPGSPRRRTLSAGSHA